MLADGIENCNRAFLLYRSIHPPSLSRVIKQRGNSTENKIPSSWKVRCGKYELVCRTTKYF